MTRSIVGDLASLPDSAFGARTLMWWGVLGFILIEGGGFALACGSYLFLMSHTDPWPPHYAQPPLLVSTLLAAMAVASELPNIWTKRMALRKNERGVQIGLVVMSLIGVALVAMRFWEFHVLNVRWDDNAYGSIVWALLFLHTTHLVTDLSDTIVVAVFTFTHEVDDDRFADIADNAVYWRFVVFAWLPIYALLYWVPRLVG
ncbi:MAG: cytochrome oxidase subunit [Caulobacteraceae bacterium]|nr:cytochrome oxidase subunit [Caulobacteraceae bacterium]